MSSVPPFCFLAGASRCSPHPLETLSQKETFPPLNRGHCVFWPSNGQPADMALEEGTWTGEVAVAKESCATASVLPPSEEGLCFPHGAPAGLLKPRFLLARPPYVELIFSTLSPGQFRLVVAVSPRPPSKNCPHSGSCDQDGPARAVWDVCEGTGRETPLMELWAGEMQTT